MSSRVGSKRLQKTARGSNDPELLKLCRPFIRTKTRAQIAKLALTLKFGLYRVRQHSLRRMTRPSGIDPGRRAGRGDLG